MVDHAVGSVHEVAPARTLLRHTLPERTPPQRNSSADNLSYDVTARNIGFCSSRSVSPGPGAAGQIGRVQAHRERRRQLTELAGVERDRRRIVLATSHPRSSPRWPEAPTVSCRSAGPSPTARYRNLPTPGGCSSPTGRGPHRGSRRRARRPLLVHRGQPRPARSHPADRDTQRPRRGPHARGEGLPRGHPGHVRPPGNGDDPTTPPQVTGVVLRCATTRSER